MESRLYVKWTFHCFGSVPTKIARMAEFGSGHWVRDKAGIDQKRSLR